MHADLVRVLSCKVAIPWRLQFKFTATPRSGSYFIILAGFCTLYRCHCFLIEEHEITHIDVFCSGIFRHSFWRM